METVHTPDNTDAAPCLPTLCRSDCNICGKDPDLRGGNAETAGSVL